MIPAFSYKNPTTIEQAIGALGDAWGKVEILAGGTDLVNLMKEGLAAPATVVNIKKIASLGGITVGDAEIKIGATVTVAEIADHPAIRKHLPALAQAAERLGAQQIRNVGTIAGSLCQRNQDWYFRLGLNPEVREESQYGAIFPTDGATYVHPSTLAPALIAYGATVRIAGANAAANAADGAAADFVSAFETESGSEFAFIGRRRRRRQAAAAANEQNVDAAAAKDDAGAKGGRGIDAARFFQVADGKTKRETVLKPNEIVTAITIPVSKDMKSANYEVRERDSHDWPLVQASVALTFDGDRVKSASIVLGHVAPVPLRSKGAEAAIIGKTLNPETAAAAGNAAVEGAKPTGKNAYKVTLAQVAVKRALLAAVGNMYWTK